MRKILAVAALICLSGQMALAAKCMILEISLDEKPIASAVFSERCGASPDSLWPYIDRITFSADKETMPNPEEGRTVVLKGKIRLVLRWSAGKVYDTVELDSLALTYGKPLTKWPDETQWYVSKDELKRVRAAHKKKAGEK